MTSRGKLYYQEKESSKIISPWLKHIAWSQAKNHDEPRNSIFYLFDEKRRFTEIFSI